MTEVFGKGLLVAKLRVKLFGSTHCIYPYNYCSQRKYFLLDMNWGPKNVCESAAKFCSRFLQSQTHLQSLIVYKSFYNQKSGFKKMRRCQLGNLGRCQTCINPFTCSA